MILWWRPAGADVPSLDSRPKWNEEDVETFEIAVNAIDAELEEIALVTDVPETSASFAEKERAVSS